MNRGKRIVIVLGAVFIVLLMISSATAVPQTNSEYVMKRVKHAEQTKRALINHDVLNENDLNNEFLKSIESDNIQDFLQNKDLNNIYDSEKIQKFVNSETFKHLTSSDFVQTLLNNNYDFESKIDTETIFLPVFAFIFGLVTWIPAIMFVIVFAYPIILLYTIVSGLYEFSLGVSHLIIGFIDCMISGFFYGIEGVKNN